VDKYTLYMRDCKTEVAIVDLPPFDPKPDVILYGTQGFVAQRPNGFGQPIYVEATVAWAPVRKKV
jgi:hypothetical protein